MAGMARREEEQAAWYPDAKRLRTDDDEGGVFRWKKKEVEEQRAGLSRHDVERRDAARRAEAEREAERLRARRVQRENARREREEEEARRARQAESAVMADWVAKEDEFMLQQSKARAAIRVRDHRARPIDWLVMPLLDDTEYDDEVDVPLKEPTAYMDTLAPSELQELHADIQTFVRLDADRAAYWKDALIVCDDRCRRVRHQDQTHVDPSILADADALLADKSADELLELQTSIRSKMRSGEPLDVEYWDMMLRRIVVWRSVAKLRAVHEKTVQEKIAKRRHEQRCDAERHCAELAEQLDTPRKYDVVWDAAEMEPPGRPVHDLTPEERPLPMYTPASLRAKLREARRDVLSRSYIPRQQTEWHRSCQTADDFVRQEAARAMGVNEEAFHDDVRLTQQAHHGESKYRIRKPRYFNRVHTGYEWNRYNQVHYDAEHPPPKQVQGYKFHLFYPDLLDPMQAPTYRVLPDPEGPGDTVLLRFSAGPPYEDVAFRIVQREWDYSYKRGFRSSFDRGILQLHCMYTTLTQSTLSDSSTASNYLMMRPAPPQVLHSSSSPNRENRSLAFPVPPHL